jgi:hypothetical protein
MEETLSHRSSVPFLHLRLENKDKKEERSLEQGGNGGTPIRCLRRFHSSVAPMFPVKPRPRHRPLLRVAAGQRGLPRLGGRCRRPQWRGCTALAGGPRKAATTVLRSYPARRGVWSGGPGGGRGAARFVSRIGLRRQPASAGRHGSFRGGCPQRVTRTAGLRQ